MIFSCILLEVLNLILYTAAVTEIVSFHLKETWSPCVAWVVGRRLEDYKHIEALNNIVQTGLRKLFSVITKEQLCIDVSN